MIETLLTDPTGPLARRRIAPNPSPMTERGTNTYLVGADAVAVIDPGPDRPDHRGALLEAVEAGGGRVVAILLTHSHIDHSAGARALAQETGAEILAFGAHGVGQSETMRRLTGRAELGGGEGADLGFAPDRRLFDGEEITPPSGAWRLTALHTPGHLGNHLCFALADGAGRARGLFSGDLVMGWSTSLVSPPDGDMGAFMASLERLLEREDPIYFPGHGAPVTEPRRRVEALKAHRLGREAQILAALAEGPLDAPALVARLYADVDPKLHGMAQRNVLAHLIDLWERGQVTAADGPDRAAAADPEFDPAARFATR